MRTFVHLGAESLKRACEIVFNSDTRDDVAPSASDRRNCPCRNQSVRRVSTDFENATHFLGGKPSCAQSRRRVQWSSKPQWPPFDAPPIPSDRPTMRWHRSIITALELRLSAAKLREAGDPTRSVPCNAIVGRVTVPSGSRAGRGTSVAAGWHNDEVCTAREEPARC
jgi:hypothetical protein